MSAATGARLDVKGIRAGFGAATVLHGVDLSVKSGEVVAILGLNGAGKSVTLKVLAGLIPARAGRVELNGEDITSLTPEQRVARGMGHVLQGRHVFGELDVEQNLRLGAYLLRRRDPGAYDGALAAVFDRFPRLAERRRQLAGSLSGGEQAMLAVGRALMGGPRIVLVDEPTAGLAPGISAGLVDTLEATRETGVTMLLVEQNTRFALDLADRILVMRQGVVVHESSVDDIDAAQLASHLGIGRLLSASLGKSTAAPRDEAFRADGDKPSANKPAAKRKAAARKAPIKKAVSKEAVSKKEASPKKAVAAKRPSAKNTPAKRAAPKKRPVAKKAAAKKRAAR